MQEAIEVAAAYRTSQTNELHRMTGGVVLVFDGLAYGWKDRLRDPQHERPGALAIDARGVIFEAVGGNDQDGAKAWEEIERPVMDTFGGDL